MSEKEKHEFIRNITIQDPRRTLDELPDEKPIGRVREGQKKQTHDLKEQVYRRSVTFFATNEHVFTFLDAVYVSQFGLHEATQTLEALKTGAEKGIEDVADLGRGLERAALKAGYGATIGAASVSKLVDAIVDYQTESVREIATLRRESEANAKEVARMVNEGKERVKQAIVGYREAKPAA